MSIRNGLFSSESVSERHPNKLADRISDAVLDEFLKLEPIARVSCETLLADQSVVVAGVVIYTGKLPFNYAEEHGPGIRCGIIRAARS